VNKNLPVNGYEFFMVISRSLSFSLFAALLCLSGVGCSKPAEVKVAKVSRQRVEATVSGVSSGTVRSEQISELAFGLVGRVKALNVKLGDLVKSGAVLAEIENNDLRSRLDAAREELERRRRLMSDNAMSRSSFIEAQSEFDSANTTLEKSIIRAPCDGLVAELNLEIGQLSQITAVIPKPLIRVVDLKPRYVRAEIDEVDLSRMRVGLPVRVKILAIRREPFQGRVRKVVNYISNLREQDRTSEIEVDIENEGVLLPAGASADIEVITDAKESVLTVASRALLGRGSQRYVFVAENGKAVRRPVTLGIYNYAASEIVSGLTEGEEALLPSDKIDLQDGLKVTVVRQ
jgi:HlyD family secretion protein